MVFALSNKDGVVLNCINQTMLLSLLPVLSWIPE
jgi:hypothetical protein